ncbi:MAG: putative DNA-binding domain-containing protein [Vicinamibacterales bacterium]
MSLAELQAQIRNAVVDGALPEGLLLIGGHDPLKRLVVHQRHFEASLANAVIGRFQATAWLIGPARLEAAARDFVHLHPPTAPCIADYGQAFAAFLAEWPATASLTYLREFAALDWQLGRLSVCVDGPALGPADLASVGLEHLPDARVTLQEGLYLTQATWGVDELMQIYLADASPDTWRLQEDCVWLEARGTRGTLRFARLDAGTLAFREAARSGATLAEAADLALGVDDAFEPAAALMVLINDGLITQIALEQEGPHS